jgi:DNA-binding response OmpR family regulator
MNVLLVDDEQEICALLALMLRRAGIRSSAAHSIEAAQVALDAARFDAVFVDVGLPDGRGYELIPAIRHHDPRCKVIVISAVDHESERALEEGADLFLAKPFTWRLILEKLQTLIPTNPS